MLAYQCCKVQLGYLPLRRVSRYVMSCNLCKTITKLHLIDKRNFCKGSTYHLKTPLIFFVQLAVGFGTSIILLTMACIMMYRLPGVGPANIDASGILSCMWIAYWRPQLQDLFLRVVEPTTDNLRTMGMVEVQLRMNPHLSVENTGHQRRVNDPL